MWQKTTQSMERRREEKRGGKRWMVRVWWVPLFDSSLSGPLFNDRYISLPWIASLSVTRTTGADKVICQECRKHTCTKSLKSSIYEVVSSDTLQWLWWLLQSCKGLCSRQPSLMAFKVCWITSYASSILWGQGKTREGKGMEGREGIVARINYAPHIWQFLAVNTETVNIIWMS